MHMLSYYLQIRMVKPCMLFIFVMSYIFFCPLKFTAQVRGILAQLGYDKLDDIIGRTDLLRPRDISLVKTQHLDLSYVLSVGL